MEDPIRLSEAKAGDESAFRALTDPYRRELTVHCYRMLGSIEDAEDTLQDALVRAWQALARFEGRSSLRSWLYKIATNACLDALDRRKVRSLPHETHPPASPGDPIPPPTEGVWIEPLPDDLFVDAAPSADARLSEREGVALAFLAMLQRLPGKQRAALVLRDVLGFSANETAEILDLTVAAANSALQRARETTEAARKTPPPKIPDDAAVRDLLSRFMRAWDAGDASAVVALLTNDAVFSMPPLPLWFSGRDAIHAFLAHLFATRRFRTTLTRANGAPAIAIHEEGQPGVLDVLEIDGDRIRSIVAFLGADLARFGGESGVAARSAAEQKPC